VSGNPGIPAFHHFPLMYTGRTTSTIPSGTPIRRPFGMTSLHPPGSGQPPAYTFGPSSRVDFELEMGVLISQPIPLGSRILASDAAEHIFGLVLLNDWSARDVQFAEMIPMGPSNGKASGTTLSPWVVMPEAVASAACELGSARARAEMSVKPPHLRHSGDCTWDVHLEASVQGKGEDAASVLCRSNLRDAYWSPGQMLAHYASSGCGVRTGDLLGTGTASSPGHTVEEPRLGCLS
jgi:fumarylacetoacetase